MKTGVTRPTPTLSTQGEEHTSLGAEWVGPAECPREWPQEWSLVPLCWPQSQKPL